MTDHDRQQYQGATCRDCTCRDCSPITAAAERLDIWKTAHRTLTDITWPSSYDIDPRDVLILATWLLQEGIRVASAPAEES